MDRALNAAAGGSFAIGGELPVHRLGYGTMRLVGEGAWGEPDDAANARRVLRRAVELGVNLIDTADAYGPEIAERLIGEALWPYPQGAGHRDQGRDHAAGAGEDGVRGARGLSDPMRGDEPAAAQAGRIELYQLHRIDPRTPLEESLGALKRMQEQGKIRHIGLSEVSPAEIEEAGKIVKVVTVQNRYSLADRRHEETLAYCEKNGIGFLPWYPMAGGKMLKAEHPAAAGAGADCGAARGERGAALAGVAAAEVAGDAADSGNIEGGASGGERGGGGNQPRPRSLRTA